MFKVHSIAESPDGYAGYMETPYFYVYYLIQSDGELFFDERYAKNKYKSFTHFKNIIRKVEDGIKFLRPPIEIEEMEYSRIEQFYLQRCL